MPTAPEKIFVAYTLHLKKETMDVVKLHNSKQRTLGAFLAKRLDLIGLHQVWSKDHQHQNHLEVDNTKSLGVGPSCEIPCNYYAHSLILMHIEV